MTPSRLTLGLPCINPTAAAHEQSNVCQGCFHPGPGLAVLGLDWVNLDFLIHAHHNANELLFTLFFLSLKKRYPGLRFETLSPGLC